MRPIFIYGFLGAEFFIDPIKPLVRLQEKWLQKFSAVALSSECTLREFLSIFGKLNYASSILNLSRAPYFLIFKFMRRRVGVHLDECAHIWPCLVPCLAAWRARILENKPRQIVTECEPVTTLYTDASLSGWGAIAIRSDGVISVVAGRWQEEEEAHSINILEGKALVNGVEGLDMDYMLDIHVDNTSLLYNVRRSRSRNFMFNNIVGALDRGEDKKYYIHQISG